MDLIEANHRNPNRHPWEIARAASLLSLVRALPLTTQYTDVGAGDMLYVTRQLAERSIHRVIAVDTAFALPVAASMVDAHTSISKVPRAGTDCAFLMDVLEHVDRDDVFLREALTIMRPGGLVVITVPAHRRLWSDHDVFLGHRRRYSRRDLLQLLESCGLIVHECFYFFAIALAARIIARGLSRRATITRRPRGVGAWRFDQAHPFTQIASFLLETDFAINRTLGRFSLPTVGLSICAVCCAPSRAP
jgi:SAM-dependent methyltransferase